MQRQPESRHAARLLTFLVCTASFREASAFRKQYGVLIAGELPQLDEAGVRSASGDGKQTRTVVVKQQATKNTSRVSHLPSNASAATRSASNSQVADVPLAAAPELAPSALAEVPHQQNASEIGARPERAPSAPSTFADGPPSAPAEGPLRNASESSQQNASVIVGTVARSSDELLEGPLQKNASVIAGVVPATAQALLELFIHEPVDPNKHFQWPVAIVVGVAAGWCCCCLCQAALTATTPPPVGQRSSPLDGAFMRHAASEPFGSAAFSERMGWTGSPAPPEPDARRNMLGKAQRTLEKLRN